MGIVKQSGISWRVAAGTAIALICLVVFAVESASAANPIGCKWSTSSPTWRYYGSNAAAEGYLASAAGTWNSANLDAKLVKTTSSSPHMLVYYANYGSQSWDGQTTWTNCGGGIFVPGGTTVKGNSYFLDGYSALKRKGVLVHEFGHSLGLNHNNAKNSCGGAIAIMTDKTPNRINCSGTFLSTPQSDDKTGINNIY